MNSRSAALRRCQNHGSVFLPVSPAAAGRELQGARKTPLPFRAEGASCRRCTPLDRHRTSASFREPIAEGQPVHPKMQYIQSVTGIIRRSALHRRGTGWADVEAVRPSGLRDPHRTPARKTRMLSHRTSSSSDVLVDRDVHRIDARLDPEVMELPLVIWRRCAARGGVKSTGAVPAPCTVLVLQEAAWSALLPPVRRRLLRSLPVGRSFEL